MRKAALNFALLCTLLSGFLWAASKEEGAPRLTLTARPRMLIRPGMVTIIAKLEGREEEKYYCPEVEWEWSDLTHSSEGGDCEPFAQRTEYPRTWSHVTFLGEGEHTITARLLRNGKSLAVQSVVVKVME